MYKRRRGERSQSQPLEQFEEQDLAQLRSREPRAAEQFERYFGPLIRLKLRALYPPDRPYDDGLTREVLWSVLIKIDEGFPWDPRELPALVVEVCHEVAKRSRDSVSLDEQTESTLTRPSLFDLLSEDSAPYRY